MIRGSVNTLRWAVAVAILVGLGPEVAYSTIPILPTPQYYEPLSSSLDIKSNGVSIALGPAKNASNSKMRLAAESLLDEIREMAPQAKVVLGPQKEGLGSRQITLWNYAADPNPNVKLNFLDRQTLEDSEHYGQSYVIRTPDENSLWVIGSTEQGVLFGVMSVLQLILKRDDGIQIAGAYIRDYPEFEFRAASDWLLNIEINGWAYDRGQGVEAFLRLCEEKLDRALRYKINGVLIDGFGFSVEKRPAYYKQVMLRLNRYARARGIHLYFGGYGASYGMAYEPAIMYERGHAFKGTVFENRESYPNGPTYRCMGFPHTRKGYDPSILGSCRSNDNLNALKGAELSEFVRAVEPGMLYIHHEDFGGFEGTEAAWRDRCERCRKRWPNDSLAASDGGAGGLAYGYSALVRAVNTVKNKESGYDASRDCQIVLISPVYLPDSPEADDWAEVLELWRNIGLQLPEAANIQAGFREVFPQYHGGEQWTKRYDSVMKAAGLDLGMFMFFSGGADRFMTDYPLSGNPAMNRLFFGAQTIYNASGDFYQEPMELLNAEYSWNSHSTGFYQLPSTYKNAIEMWRENMYEEGQPPEIFGSDSLFQMICQKLYGPKAGPEMAKFYQESSYLPEPSTSPTESDGRYYYRRPQTYIPLTWDRAYAASSHWRHLLEDSNTWGKDFVDERYAATVSKMKLDRAELHRRLARRWKISARLNSEGRHHVERALEADPRIEAVADLRFLKSVLEAYQPLMEALADFHSALTVIHSKESIETSVQQDLQRALNRAREASALAEVSFPNPIDPVGGEIGALRKSSAQLITAIETALNEL